MRILFISYSMRRGGSERVVSSLGNEFVELGHDVSILTFVPAEADKYILNKKIERLYISEAKDSSNIIQGIYNNHARVIRLRNTIKKSRYDAVVAMGYTNSVLLALAGIGLSGVVRVGTERTYPPLASVSFAWKLACKYCYGFLDSFVCLTKQTANWVEDNTRVKRVTVIPNGSTYPLQPGLPFVSTDCAQNDWKIVLCVGRLVSAKQFDHAIMAFSNVAVKNPDWHLFFAGDGNLLADLKALSRKLKVEENVHFLKEVGNVGDWLDRADIFILTSAREGFPNSLLEAFMYGKPAISYDCPTGPSDLIGSGVNGCLVPANDVKKLEESLHILMNDSSRREAYADKAKIKSNDFMIANVAKKWVDEFKLILEKK